MRDFPPSIAVYVCTYKRNDALRNMLEALSKAAERVSDRAQIAAVVIDDNPDGRASEVVDEFVGRFELGIHYRHSGKQNISIARNLGLETGAELADWVAMTDDDCEPDAEWLVAMLDTLDATGADALTGPLLLRFPPGSAGWLSDEPFAIGENELFEDRAPMPLAQTHNSIISCTWLRKHPDVRFDPDLGRLGGEDMVFYRTAVECGLRINYARHAVVHEVVPPARANLRHQLRTQYWLGNSEYVTNTQSGMASPRRMVLRAGRRCLKALARPFARMARGERPQWRWCVATVLRSVGMAIGVLGIRIDHR
jgi:succinoglycan biosynthesis protein ExoM